MSKTVLAKIEWLPKKTFTLSFAIPWEKVKKTYDEVLTQLIKEAKIEGFRKGKAPQKIVEKSIDKGKLYGEVINQLLPLSYAQAVSQHQLKPAVAPQIKILAAEENKPWQFEAMSCELPEVKLGDYQKIVRGALAANKIWTPNQGSPTKNKAKSELTDTQKINLIAKALISEISVDLPDMLINSEKDRQLSQLLDQTQKLGITIDQYAQSTGKSVEQVKKDYHQSAENSLKLELILQSIADDKKFTVNDKDIDQMIAASGDEKIKTELNKPSQRAYIASVLKKRQAIDYLLSL